MMFNRFWKTPRLSRCMVLCAVSAACLAAPAQQENTVEDRMAKLRADELLKEADFELNADRPTAAAPYLWEYLRRSAGETDERILSTSQEIRIKLGRILAQQPGKMKDAADLFAQYTTNRPALDWNEAMLLRSGALLEMEQWAGCIDVTTNALAGPPEDVRQEIAEAKARAEALAKLNAAGQEYQFDKYGNVVQPGAGGAEAEADPSGYSKAQLLVLNMNLGEAYRETNRRDLAIEPYTYVLENTTNSTHKGYAIMQVVNGLIDKQDFQRIQQLIPQFYRTEARYDIRVNMALMNAAVALYDAGEYDSALPLFRMILPRKEMLEYLAKKMLPIQIRAGIAPKGMTPQQFKELADVTIMGKRNAVVAVEETWSDEERTNPDLNKPKELLDLEELQRTIQGLPPYEDEVLFRSAYVYDKVDRPWEAARFFDRVAQADTDGDKGRQSFYEMIRILLTPLNERNEAETRGFDYLDSHNGGLLPRQILYLLSGYYLQQQLAANVTNLMPRIEGLEPDSSHDARRYECELYYQQAVANMVLLDYPGAQKLFEKVLTSFPGSMQQENATYWRAVAIAYQQQYETALQLFEDYLKGYPNGNWVASALFQSGTCRFGMEEYEKAFDLFTAVIDRFPESPVYSDARSLRGDIHGSRGELDEAVADYKAAFAAAKTHQQGKYATFQMAAVYEADAKALNDPSRYDALLKAVDAYLARYKEKADIAEGIFWIGKTRLNQGRADEAVNAYLDAIARYGGDLNQGGVDSIIAELTRLSRRQLTPAQLKSCREKFENLVKTSDSQTLRLRVRAMLADMDGTRIELGRQLLGELTDLEGAAPPVLAAMADAAFQNKDYSRSGEIMDIFLRKYPESEYIPSAFKLRAYALFGQQQYDEALRVIADVQARYGTAQDAAWAQLMKGRIYLAKNEFDPARKELKAVFSEPSWRGEPQAEAAFAMGTLEEAAGDLTAAQGWYQRTYFQFKAYAGGRWAADAYLASARCLQKLGYTQDVRNTYRAMLFDKYVRNLPQAQTARQALGAAETADIAQKVASGFHTNITISVQQEDGN